uniref:(northern house mosquito) hypothetical protein n=1 Tax=Culex pipiens TaxID=7175 RepID=A0A8D8CEB4_CULPI
MLPSSERVRLKPVHEHFVKNSRVNSESTSLRQTVAPFPVCWFFPNILPIERIASITNSSSLQFSSRDFSSSKEFTGESENFFNFTFWFEVDAFGTRLFEAKKSTLAFMRHTKPRV